jgi:hypothetical protein
VAKLIEAAAATPKGAKKALGGDMYKAYHPKAVEAAWYEWWVACLAAGGGSSSCSCAWRCAQRARALGPGAGGVGSAG